MTDSKNVLIISVFIGFISLFVFLGAGNYLDISGTDRIDSLEPPEINKINITDYEQENNTVLTKFNNSDPDFNEFDKGLEWDGNGSNGTVIYDITNFNELEVVTTPNTFFLGCEIEIAFLNASGDVVSSDSSHRSCGQQTINLSNNWDFVRFTFTEKDWYLYELEGIIGNDPGFVDTLRNLINAFILETSTKWVLFLVVLPLTAFAIFLLVKYAGNYIPFT